MDQKKKKIILENAKVYLRAPPLPAYREGGRCGPRKDVILRWKNLPKLSA